ncbi:MAG: cytochrome b/b6 domain-containing protein, partial [Pseudomonadota bacterium]
MSMSNTLSSYGSIAKAFHWTLAIAIFALIALGITASELPADTSEQITVKATLFSIHKTLGLAVFALALLRILWALSQPKPAPLNPEKPVELLMAQIAHWLLYASLLLVPLSGWIHHAATTGFAPIWWPFGQSLPFVPKDPQVADAFGGLHVVFERVLVFTLVLHMAGALKHHFWDRDDTLRRMLPGMAPRGAPAPYAPKKAPAFVAPASALGVLLVALSIGASLGLYSKSTAIAAQPPLLADAPAAAQTESAWIVGSGDIAISIRQLGSGVTGRFADWTAEIDFAEEAVDGRHGSVRTTIAIPSLTLGSVTSEAMNAAYFDAETFPT